ncbi:membrane protein, putative [Citrifermentans bemidjiense Bem]|uniref:Membrane protein, putative n=1 Tax=Citrifermentans bemidjiense (strain ATCC BAA-1014 / DSM 16622 / JCM 12645 / Bem) TaxID=404380 RepID=B5EGW3_CITBB|nr:ABC transporter permease [Citrifermentans bemidjiense]ACH39596.1 membrane protein, putative [Citrifermentans bemidjiense Bem]
MFAVVGITLKGILRDRVFQGIMALAVLLIFIPFAASLSMRQVTELSITLSLSLICFILLLLSVFLGATSIWKDMERRYSFSVLSLPITRTSYVLGRFFGLALFLALTASLLGGVSCMVIKIASGMYPPDRPVVMGYVLLAICFATLKYILLVAVALLLSTVSTSFFLPVFGTLCTFLASAITQQVYEYVHSAAAIKAVTPLMKSTVTFAYYLLPNLSGFDLNVNAIYSIAPNLAGLGLTVAYFCSYTAVLLGIATLLFNRREMK